MPPEEFKMSFVPLDVKLEAANKHVLRNWFSTDREVWYLIYWYCKLRHDTAVTQTQLSGKLTCRREPCLRPLMTLRRFSGGFYLR